VVDVVDVQAILGGAGVSIGLNTDFRLILPSNATPRCGSSSRTELAESEPAMDRLPTIATWVTVIAGLYILANGASILARRRIYRSERKPTRGLEWRPLGLMQLWFGVAFLTGAVPRLVGLTSGWVLVFSIIALVPVAVGVKCRLSLRVPPETAVSLADGSDKVA
jgi:hypothetical protein